MPQIEPAHLRSVTCSAAFATRPSSVRSGPRVLSKARDDQLLVDVRARRDGFAQERPRVSGDATESRVVFLDGRAHARAAPGARSSASSAAGVRRQQVGHEGEIGLVDQRQRQRAGLLAEQNVVAVQRVVGRRRRAPATRVSRSAARSCCAEVRQHQSAVGGRQTGPATARCARAGRAAPRRCRGSPAAPTSNGRFMIVGTLA